MERKQKKRSLRLTLLLLLLTAILLIMSSYAWFTANQTVTISQLDVNVAAQNGLQISADGITWSALLELDDLKTAAATYPVLTNQFPSYMVPVSTIGDVNEENGRMKMFLGTVEANETTGKDELTAELSPENTGSDGHYIAFDMFLKVEATTTVALTANSNVKENVAVEGQATKGIENAARVAFVIEGTKAAGDSVSEIQALKGATNTTRYIWEPNCDSHTDAARAHARNTYGITTIDSPMAYDGIKAEIENGIVLMETNRDKNATYFGSTPIAVSTVKGNVAEHNIFELQAGITKVRVYMWVEGQDIDCENNASGANIGFNVQLTKVDTAIVP